MCLNSLRGSNVDVPQAPRRTNGYRKPFARQMLRRSPSADKWLQEALRRTDAQSENLRVCTECEEAATTSTSITTTATTTRKRRRSAIYKNTTRRKGRRSTIYNNTDDYNKRGPEDEVCVELGPRILNECRLFSGEFGPRLLNGCRLFSGAFWIPAFK